jgi:hypothetical protein
MAWYAEAHHGDILDIALPALEWRLRLTRRHCGVTWRLPGQQHDASVWLDQVVSWVAALTSDESYRLRRFASTH